MDDRTHGQPLNVRLQDAWTILVGRSGRSLSGRTIYESGLWLKDPHSPVLLSYACLTSQHTYHCHPPAATMITDVTSIAQFHEIVRRPCHSACLNSIGRSLTHIHVTHAQINSDEYSVVDFHADWSGPCHVRSSLAPALHPLLT